MAGGGGGLKNESHSRDVNMSYLHTKGIVPGDTALLSHRLQLPCYLGHTTGSTFRNVGTKGRGGKVVSGGPKRILMVKGKLKEGRRPGYLA